MDHSLGCASIARALNAAIDGQCLDAGVLTLACQATGTDFALAVLAMSKVGLVAFQGDKLILGPLGRALVVGAYIGG